VRLPVSGRCTEAGLASSGEVMRKAALVRRTATLALGRRARSVVMLALYAGQQTQAVAYWTSRQRETISAVNQLIAAWRSRPPELFAGHGRCRAGGCGKRLDCYPDRGPVR